MASQQVVFSVWLLSLRITLFGDHPCGNTFWNVLPFIVEEHPMCKHTSCCLSVCEWVSIWLVSGLDLLWVILIWTSRPILCVVMVPLLWGRYCGVQLFIHMVNICLAFQETAEQFHNIFFEASKEWSSDRVALSRALSIPRTSIPSSFCLLYFPGSASSCSLSLHVLFFFIFFYLFGLC